MVGVYFNFIPPGEFWRRKKCNWIPRLFMTKLLEKNEVSQYSGVNKNVVTLKVRRGATYNSVLQALSRVEVLVEE